MENNDRELPRIDNHVFHFGTFELDARSGELHKSGLRLKLPEQPVQVLLFLLENAGQVVTREQLRDQLWPADTFVDFDKGVNRAINKIREALGDHAESPRFVETLPRRGYRFIAAVEKKFAAENGCQIEQPGNAAAQAESPAENLPVIEKSARTRPWWKSRLPWIAAVLTLVLIPLATSWWHSITPPSSRLIRLGLQLGIRTNENARSATAILSADGTRLVFSGWGADGKYRLFSRLLDQPDSVPLSGSEDASYGFFSPDGQWVGFLAGNKLKKMPVQGGAIVDLCDVSPIHFRGASWGDDGNIVAALSASGGLSRFASSGGIPQPVTELDRQHKDVTHRWPQVLPGSQSILFTSHDAGGNFDEASIEAQSLATGKRIVLHRGGYYGRYLPSGHLLFVRQRTLFAAPMDLAGLKLTGPAVPVLHDVVGDPDIGTAAIGFSGTGSAVCLTGPWAPRKRALAWIDAEGKRQSLPVAADAYGDLRVSPDGKRIVFSIRHGIGDWQLWVYDWESERMTRLTFGAVNITPEWHPDSRHIVFVSDRHRGMPGLYWMRADGAGETSRLIENQNLQWPYSISPDGKRLAYVEADPKTGSDIWILPLEGSDSDHLKPGKPEPLSRTPLTEECPSFSPDGRWLAYQSNQSGRLEVYVRSLSQPGGEWQISNNGGRLPVWSRNRKELFFLNEENRILVTEYKTKSDAFIADKSRRWSDTRIPSPQNTIRNFDLDFSGTRILTLAEPESPLVSVPATQLTMLLNFFDEVRRLTK
jgi:DNA-binding winged helix-turn-helix (wHTH) protein